MVKINLIKVVGLLVVILWGSTSFASELIESCNKCHGANGVSSDPTVPTIAGISATSLEDLMYGYLDEIRPAPQHDGKDMKTILSALSDEEIKEVAAHYAGLPFVPAKQPFDAAKAEAGAKVHQAQCSKCHSEGGTVAKDDASLLGGQWTPYLRTELEAFHAGSRQGESSMTNAIKGLKAEHIEELLNYYASYQPDE